MEEANPRNCDFAEMEAQAIFQSLIKDAVHLPGDHGIPHDRILVAVQPDEAMKLGEGRAFFQRHFVSILWALSGGLLAGIAVQRVSQVVLRTGNYKSVKYSVTRGISTLQHFTEWMKEGFEEASSEAAKDAHRVRKIHAHALKTLASLPVARLMTPKENYIPVFEAVRKDLAHVHTPEYIPDMINPNPSVLMSQFDMVIVLIFAFFILDTNPNCAGLYTNEGYESYIYYIGTIGRYLGIQDRFNIALLPNPEVRKNVCRKIRDEIFKPCYKNFTESDFLTACYYWEAIRIPGLVETLFHFILKDFLGLEGAEHIIGSSCRSSRFTRKLVKFGLSLMRFALPKWTANVAANTLLSVGFLWLNWSLPARVQRT